MFNDNGTTQKIIKQKYAVKIISTIENEQNMIVCSNYCINYMHTIFFNLKRNNSAALCVGHFHTIYTIHS